MHRLRNFGDPRKSWRWKTGEVDYVASLGLTRDEIPELVALASQWANEPADPADPDDMSAYAPVHAWRALAQLRAEGAVEPLLAMLDAADARGDDWYPQELPHVFAWIGKAALPALRDYLADEAHGDFPRACAAAGLKELAGRHGTSRGEAFAALTEVLSRFKRNAEPLNSFLVRYLIEMDAPNARDLVARAVASGRTDPHITGAWREESG